MRIHHGYIGAALILLCILTYFGIGVVGKFNFYVWIVGLVLGVVLLVHDAYWHITHRKRSEKMAKFKCARCGHEFTMMLVSGIVIKEIKCPKCGHNILLVEEPIELC